MMIWLESMTSTHWMLSTMIVTISLTLTTNNPSKMSWKLMATMVLTCYYLYSSITNSILSLMMVMTMTGGLLMLYMILTSTMPNNSMKNNKLEMEIMLLMVIFTMMSQEPKMVESNSNHMVSFMTSWTSVLATLTLMSLYASSALSLNDKEKISMRSYT